MKKGLAIVGIGALTLALTGCGEVKRTMVCTLEEEQDYGMVKTEIKLRYEGDVILEEEENVYLELSETYSEDVVENIETNRKENCDERGLECEITVKGNKIEVRTTTSADELTDPNIDEETPYEDAKEILADRGYSCN